MPGDSTCDQQRIRASRDRAGQRGSRRVGLSYFESVITVMILGILAAVAVPEAGSVLARQRLRAAARTVAASISESIEEARSDGESREVLFAVGSDQVYVPAQVDPKTRRLPRVIDLSSFASNLIVTQASFGATGDSFFHVDQQGRRVHEGSVTLTLGSRRISIFVTQAGVTLGDIQ